MDREWKYKIKYSVSSLVPSLLMLAVFGGLALWLYKTNNGAFMFAGILAVFTAVIILISIYRLLFFKVYICDDGFYYQTQIGNGKFYPYAEVEKAWITDGETQNGSNLQYCNIAFYDDNTIRFNFTYKDEEAVDYLTEFANADTNSFDPFAQKEKDDYLIDGKVYGRARIFISSMFLAVIVFLDVTMAHSLENISFAFVLIPSIIFGVGVVIYLLNYFLCFKIKIEREGFYYQTNPFNAHYYTYNEVKTCRIIRKVVKNRSARKASGNTNYYFFFEFTDENGKKHKFQYEEYLFAHEIDVLKNRIDAQGNNI